LNGWHFVRVTGDGYTFKWTNHAGVTWTLTNPNEEGGRPEYLNVGEDCPYYNNGHTEAKLHWDGDNLLGVSGPWNEYYEFV